MGPVMPEDPQAKNSGRVLEKLPVLLTFSLLVREYVCFLLDFPSGGSIFSTFVGGYKKHCDR